MSSAQESVVYIPYTDGKKWSVADRNGQVQFKPKFEETFPSSRNRIRFRENNKYGFINPSGEIVIPPIYKKATDFDYFGGILFSYVSKADSTFYIDMDGNPIVPKYGCGGVISNNPNGLYVFKEDSMYGVIALGNDTVIKPTYKFIKNYNNGAFVFAQNFKDKYGVLNYLGDTLYGFSLDSVIYDRTYIRSPVFKVYENNRVGVIDRDGVLQANPQYDAVKPYVTGSLMCYQVFRKGTLIGYIYEQREYWK